MNGPFLAFFARNGPFISVPASPGAAPARTGDELSGPALLLLVLGVTGSASTASWLMAGLTGSAAIGGPVFGAVLDRSPRPGRVLAAALAGYAPVLAVILTALGHVPTPLVIAVAVAAGLVNPAIAGGWTSQVPQVLGGRDLGRASNWDAMTFSVASLLGLAATLAKASVAMALAVALVVAALPVAWSLPARTTSKTALKSQLAAGFRLLVTSRPLTRATVTSMVSYVGVGMSVVCYPLLGAQRLDGAGKGARLLAVGARRGRRRIRRRSAAHRAVRDPAPRDPGPAPGTGLQHGGEPEDHEFHRRLGHRRSARDVFPDGLPARFGRGAAPGGADLPARRRQKAIACARRLTSVW
jgi:MFS family permease